MPALSSLDPYAQVMALRCHAFMLLRLGEMGPAAQLSEESLEIARTTGDERTIVDALSISGGAAAEGGRYDQARAWYGEMIERSLRLGYERGVSVATHNLGLVEFASGDIERARQLHAEALALDRSSGSSYGQMNSVNSLAMVSIQLGEIEEAAALLAEHMDIAERSELEVSTPVFALIAAARGRFQEAAQLLGATAAASERVGVDMYGSAWPAGFFSRSSSQSKKNWSRTNWPGPSPRAGPSSIRQLPAFAGLNRAHRHESGRSGDVHGCRDPLERA